MSVLHAFSQNDIAVIGETSTGGYYLLKLELSRTQKLKTDPTDIKQTRVGMVGNNLHIEDIRNHVSHIPKIRC